MSAYIEPKTHIATIARWAVEKDIKYFYNPFNKQMVEFEIGAVRLNSKNDLYKMFAEMLERQNVNSVNERYRNENNEYRKYEHFSEGLGSDNITREEVLSAIHGYEYQSCETNDWFETNVYWLLQSLKRKLINDVIDVAGLECWTIENERKKHKKSLI